MKRMASALVLALVAWPVGLGANPGAGNDFPSVLKIRERVATVNRIVEARLDQVLPLAMREAGFDMWIIASNEDN